MAFLIFSLVYFVVTFRACMLAFFAISEMSFIHVSWGMWEGGGVRICVCWSFCSSVQIGWLRHSGLSFTILIVFRIMWYVARCCFHVFESLRGSYPPCCDVRFVICGMYWALQVCSSILEMLLISRSNVLHASFHCV